MAEDLPVPVVEGVVVGLLEPDKEIGELDPATHGQVWLAQEGFQAAMCFKGIQRGRDYSVLVGSRSFGGGRVRRRAVCRRQNTPI